MSLQPAPSPRNRINTLRQFRGVMRFSPETKEFLVYRLAVGPILPSGYMKVEEDPGNYSLGVIYLKDAEVPGYYLVHPMDLYRRRLNARPSNCLTRDAAIGVLGADPAEFSEFVAPVAADDAGPLQDASPEELEAINLLVQEQEGAIHHLEAAKAS